jgi:hypothetical protein
VALFWLLLLIVMLAVLSAGASEEANRLEPHDSIRAIGSQARREAEDLSDEFLRRAIDLLNQKRR